MIRAIDWRCNACGEEILNAMADECEWRACPKCHVNMEQVWWKRTRRPAQWDDNTAVMVHVDPRTGDVRYPGQHDAQLKPGYERVYLRSLREVERFERQHNVRSEMAWYDKGSGRGFDDYLRGEKVTH